jgi:large subunit ribosomal protein L5
MSETEQTTAVEAHEPRLKTYFREQVTPGMMERFGLENRLAVPRLSRIVINMGVGEAVSDQNALADAVQTLRTIAGQQPITTRARRSVAGFRLREGVPVGCKVTLRGDRMYEFLDRLISIVLPRVRDFRGLSANSFDGTGNYSLGIQESAVFPELDLDSLKTIHGMDIAIVTTARTDQEAFELLRMMGMPFRE